MASMAPQDEDLYNQRALDRVLAPSRNVARRAGPRPALNEGGPAARNTVPGLEASADPTAADMRYRMPTEPGGPATRSGSNRDAPTPKMPMPDDVPADVQAARDAEQANPTGPSYSDVVRQGRGGINPNSRAQAESLQEAPATDPVEDVIRRSAGLTDPPPAPDAGPASDPSAWDTDGYGKPAFVTPVSGEPPPGIVVDPKKWADPNHQTPKYVWLRIAAANPGDQKKQVAELLRAYPGATFNGKDTVEGIPGLGPIDIFKGASQGLNEPQWYDKNAAAAEGDASGGSVAGSLASLGPASARSSGLVDAMSQGSTHEGLLAKIQAILGDSSVDQQALLKVLGG